MRDLRVSQFFETRTSRVHPSFFEKKLGGTVPPLFRRRAETSVLTDRELMANVVDMMIDIGRNQFFWFRP